MEKNKDRDGVEKQAEELDQRVKTAWVWQLFRFVFYFIDRDNRRDT